jgi:hypothetical protein
MFGRWTHGNGELDPMTVFLLHTNTKYPRLSTADTPHCRKLACLAAGGRWNGSKDLSTTIHVLQLVGVFSSIVRLDIT